MIKEKLSFSEKVKNFLGKYSRFAKAAFILILVFFIVSVCTIGGFDTPGKAMRISPDDEVVFALKYNDSYSNIKNGNYLDRIYVNVGSVYTDVGSNAEITFNYATVPGSSSSSINWSSVNRLGTKKIGNIYSADNAGVSGANYNWYKFYDLTASDKDPLSTSYKLIRLTVNREMLINEVVFVDVAGNRIPAYVTTEGAQSVITSWNSLLGDAFRHNASDSVNLLDSQDNFKRDTTVYKNFTQDEAYSLMQIDNIFLGGEVYEDSTYPILSDFGSLGTLFIMLGTLVFGKSLFGLRIVPVLFTTALLAVVYLFGKILFKKDAFGFLFAALFAVGGFAFTLGRLGLAFPILAFFVVLSYYLMYKFYEKGISGDRPVKSALNILFSGLCFAAAFAIDAKALIAAIGVIVLFALGAVKRHREYVTESRAARKEMSDKNAVEMSETVMQENIDECERKEAALAADNVYKCKLIYLFFVVSFIVGTLILTVLSAVPSYFSYVKFYEADPENPTLGLFRLIGKLIKDNYALGGGTSYTLANTSGAFGWLIGLKGATLYSASAEGQYLALNVQLNPAIMITALVGLIFTTAYAILYFVTGGKKSAYGTEHSETILNAYLVLILGLLSSLFAYAFLPNVSAASAMMFTVFYVAFVPLTFYTVYAHDGGKVTSLFGIKMKPSVKLIIAFCAVYFVVFALTVPMVFGFPIDATAAKYCFGWTTFANNGFYRI